MGLAAATFAGPLSRLTGLTALQCYVTAGAFVLYGIGGNLLARHPRIREIGIGLSIFNFAGTVGALALTASTVLPFRPTEDRVRQG